MANTDPKKISAAGTKKPAAPKRTPPASDVISPTPPSTAFVRDPAKLRQAAEAKELQQYAGPAFYDEGKMNAVRMQRGGAPVHDASQGMPRALRPTPTPSPTPRPGRQEFLPQPSSDRRAFAAEALAPEAAGAPAGAGSGRVEAALRQGLGLAPAKPLARGGSVQQALAQNLLSGVSTTGYSPGVMATRERERAMKQADSLALPGPIRAALQQRIQAGDTGAVHRAAELVTSLSDPAKLGDRRVQAALAQQLLGGEGAQKFDAGRQADLAHYKGVAQRNTEIARGNSAQALKLGLDPLADAGSVQAAIARNLGLADSATLRKMAAEDPSNGAVRTALTQAGERERKHLANETVKQKKLDEQARQRKSDDERLAFERNYMLEDLKTRAKGRGVMTADDHKQMGEAYRDYLRTQPMDPMSRDEFQRVYWEGYSPGMMGRVEEGAYNMLSGLANVASAPLRALSGQAPGHAPPGDSRYPHGLQQPQATPAPSPSPYVRPDQVEQLRKLTPAALNSLKQIVAQGGPQAEEAAHLLEAHAQLAAQ